MLLDLIMQLLSTLVHTLYGALLALVPEPPAWVLNHADEASEIWQVVQGFETWVPVTLAFQIATAVIGVWVIGLVIGLIRVVVSYLTFGGGAT